MEPLDATLWDVVLSGTDLPQSLLALALSRSEKKVLHVDRNEYYGGSEAALSLQEAEAWAEIHADSRGSSFQNAVLEKQQTDSGPKLGFSRAYSLSLSPQMVYTRSNLLPALVSSKVYRQLELLAVGSWFCYGGDTPTDFEAGLGQLQKIPSGREDVFTDRSIDLRSARSLMKFLKIASESENQLDTLIEWRSKPFSEYLSSNFKLSQKLQQPLLALTMSPSAPSETSTSLAISRIHRHLTSMGVFGPGFGSVIPKWGGLAEIAQVACRAGAVGGGVYVLKSGIEHIESKDREKEQPTPETPANTRTEEFLKLHTWDGELLQARCIVGTADQLLRDSHVLKTDPSTALVERSITIVSSSLLPLFPDPVEGAPPSACAVVVFPANSLSKLASSSDDKDIQSPPVHNPVYLSIHNSDTGECPTGQCIIYGLYQPPNLSTSMTSTSIRTSSHLLKLATSTLLSNVTTTTATGTNNDNDNDNDNNDPPPLKLWELTYTASTHLPTPATPFSPSSSDPPPYAPSPPSSSAQQPPDPHDPNPHPNPNPENTNANIPHQDPQRERIIILPPVEQSFILEDSVLKSVREAYEKIDVLLRSSGGGDEEGQTGRGGGGLGPFMQFVDRPGAGDDNDNGDGNAEEGELEQEQEYETEGDA